MHRTLQRVSTVELNNGYGTYERTERVAVEAVTDATVVTSQVAGAGIHLPVLDLDYRVEHYQDTDGRCWLWMDRPATGLRLTRALRTAARHELLTAGPPPCELLRYPTQALTELAGALMETFTGPAEELLATAARLTPDPVVCTPPEGGLWLTTRWPVTLLDSSTAGHHHLLIERPLPARDYWRLLRRFAAAGLVERGFYRMAVRRGASTVRLPGVVKQPV